MALPNWISPSGKALIAESEYSEARVLAYLKAHYYQGKQVRRQTVESALIEIDLGADEDEWEQHQADHEAEREAKHKERGAKAAATRQRNNREVVWDQVKVIIKREHCTCGLTPDMTLSELRAMRGCCDQPLRSPRYVCPALYRFRVLRGWMSSNTTRTDSSEQS